MFNQLSTQFCKQLDISLPIIQAPMAGGIVTPALVAEVIKNGGLGSLPLGYLSLIDAQVAIQQTKALTSKRFAVNIFIPAHTIQPSQESLSTMLAYINLQRLSLGLGALTALPKWVEPDLDELLEMIIEEGTSIVSFTFGILDKSLMKKLVKNHVFVMGTATTVHEGLALQAAGCHAVIAQGHEAGGHRGGGFLKKHPEGCIGIMALVPQMVDAVKIPVIASGGIMDGRGIAAALILGASAVQMGTAFVTCHESKASVMHKQMILESPAESSCITPMFTGKSVRSFKNDFITQTEKLFSQKEFPPYPIQHQMTKELRREANALSKRSLAGLWTGQGSPLSRPVSIETLMILLEKETQAAISQFHYTR